MRRVKLAAALLGLAALSLSACYTNTLVNRRDLYRPAQPSGPYTQALADGTWEKGVKVKKPKPGTAPAPAATEPAPAAGS